MKIIFTRDKFGDITFFCPLCYYMIEDFETDDYVKSNCLLWCVCCSEMLVCFRGYNTRNIEKSDASKIDDEEFEFSSKCTKLISKEEVETYFSELLLKNINDETKINKIFIGRSKFFEGDKLFFKTSILLINKIINYVYNIKDQEVTESELDDEIFEKSSQHSYDSGVIGTLTYIIPNLYSFTQIEAYCDKIDLNHSGNLLGYSAECSECGQKHTSNIWGD